MQVYTDFKGQITVKAFWPLNALSDKSLVSGGNINVGGTPGVSYLKNM